jgi:Pyruvate/2-oxoacid:ferredoxin oxidoreductase delta subunit
MPINVSTEKAESANVPTNPELYARVKAEAKAKFDVYPSAYANAWLVREYKKRGGGYRTVKKEAVMSKVAEDLAEEEAMLAEALTMIAEKYGKFNEDETGIWAGYESAEENDVKDIGVKCSNCVLYEGNGVCKIIAQQVENEGKCRFAVIPDGVVQVDNEDMSDDSEMGKSEEMINGYPAATQDIEVNISYRQEAIDKAAYGPMNPALENTEFWQRKADIFHTTVEEAKTARCKNCAAFIQTSYMKEAMAEGLGGEDIAYAVINIANLGYCEIFDFKCAGQRTCDAWVVGGPITDGNANINKSMVSIRKIQYRDPLK